MEALLDLHSGCVDVPIPSFQRFVDSIGLGIFVLPRAKANRGDLRPGVQLELRA